MSIISLCFSVCSFSITSSAANVYNSVHSEPDYNQYSGYLNLLVNDFYSSGTDLVTFAWTCFPLNNTGATPSTETIIHVNYSSVEFDWFSSSTSYYVMLWELTPDGNRVLRYSGTKNATSDGFYFSFDNNLVHGLSYKGNVNLLYPESGITQFDIPVVWASSSDEFDQLLGIYNQLVLMNETLNGKLDSMILQFSDLIIQASNTSMYLEGIHSWLIFQMMPELTALLETNNSSLSLILEQLETINLKIDQFLEMSDAEQQFVDSYQAAQQEQQENFKLILKILL